MIYLLLNGVQVFYSFLVLLSCTRAQLDQKDVELKLESAKYKFYISTTDMMLLIIFTAFYEDSLYISNQ